MKRILAGLLCAAFLAGCDVQADRFTELTGAKTKIDRVYTCYKVAEQDAVHLRVLRDRTASDEVKERTLLRIKDADDLGLKFMVMLDEYSSDELSTAFRNLDKRFTWQEFSQLFEEYGSLLKTHCADLIE